MKLEDAFKQLSDLRDENWADFAVEMRREKPRLIVALRMECRAIAFAEAAVLVGRIEMPDCADCEYGGKPDPDDLEGD